VEFYEFVNPQLIFKYPLDWERQETEVGMLFAPPDSTFVMDTDTGQQERDLGVFLVEQELPYTLPAGQILDQLTTMWTTTHPPYPNFNLISKEQKHVEGAEAAITVDYSYTIGPHFFEGVYVVAEKLPRILTMQIFGTPDRLKEIADIKDGILNSLILQNG
jgi:hypothetical protein